VTVDGFTGSGAVYTSGFSSGLGSARSDLEFEFEVSVLTAYSLSGEVIGEDDAFTIVRLEDFSGAYLESPWSYDYGNGDPDARARAFEWTFDRARVGRSGEDTLATAVRCPHLFLFDFGLYG
jgi:hypothetical protein